MTTSYSDVYEDVAEIDDITRSDFVGVAEISERLTKHAGREITRSNVTTWINRRDTQKNGFPKPLTTLAMGGLYSWVEVLDWFKAGIGRAASPEALYK